jgi:hypothetical protein
LFHLIHSAMSTCILARSFCFTVLHIIFILRFLLGYTYSSLPVLICIYRSSARAPPTPQPSTRLGTSRHTQDVSYFLTFIRGIIKEYLQVGRCSWVSIKIRKNIKLKFPS